MTGLLRHYVMNLRLRPQAPWPSGLMSTREMIKRWRAEQRLRLVSSTKGGDPGGPEERWRQEVLMP